MKEGPEGTEEEENPLGFPAGPGVGTHEAMGINKVANKGAAEEEEQLEEQLPEPPPLKSGQTGLLGGSNHEGHSRPRPRG